MRNLRLTIYLATIVHWANGMPYLTEIIRPEKMGKIDPIDLILALILLVALPKLGKLIENVKKNALLQYRILFFMLWGLVPLYVGWLYDNTHIYSFLRLFVWGVLPLVAILCFESLVQFYTYIKFYLFLHCIRIGYYDIYEIGHEGIWLEKFPMMDRFDIFASTLLIIGLYHFKDKTIIERLLFYIVLPLTLIVSISDHSRTVYILYIIAMVLFILMVSIDKSQSQSINWKIILAFTAPLLLVLSTTRDLLYLIMERYETLERIFEDESIVYRLNALEINIERIMEKPFLGYGFGADVSTLDYLQRYGQYFWRTPHNFYIEMALWGGILTVLIYLFIQLSILKKGFQSYLAAAGRAKILLITLIIIAITDLLSRVPSPSGGEGALHYWLYSTWVLVMTKLYKDST